MAWLERRGKKYRISYRLGGTLHRHSLGTADKGEADSCLARLEDSLNRLDRGWLKPPPAGADLSLFLLSGGEVTGVPPLRAPTPLILGALIQGYREAQATAIEADSLATVGTHLGHFVKSFGADFFIQSLTLDDLQRHVERRRKERGRRGKVTGYTIRKEVNTLAAAWEWAVLSNKLTGVFPNRGMKYPKDAEKPPFQTRAEIERRIEREGLVGDAAEELWDGLFLTLAEVGELLEFVRTGAMHPFLYPMVCLAAHTGMRRSELLRCRVADIDLDAGIVVIREKKRLKGKTSTRRVPLSHPSQRVKLYMFSVISEP
jgi:integrase